MPLRSTFVVVALSLLLTGVNAVKPLVIDDAAYQYYAAQISRRPLDPYGFAVNWYQVPERANDILAPPVFLYSWGLARAIVGETPWAWKLALWPWALLLVGSLHQLLRRLAPGAGLVPLAVLVLSPAILPAMNLMLDLPALALSLAAIVLFLDAVRSDSLVLSAASGLLCGLALETKYTALSTLAVLFLAAALSGRWRLWPVAVLVAVHVFLTWEMLIALLYGQSHFLLSLSQQAAPTLEIKLALLSFLPSYLGGLAGSILLLGLAALGVGWRGLVAVGGSLLIIYATIAAFDRTFENHLTPEAIRFPLAEPLFDGVTLVVTGVAIWMIVRLLRADRVAVRGTGLVGREGLFLTLWLLLEIMAFVAVTPFPAARRVLGVCVVLTLLAGRTLSLGRQPRSRAVLGGLVAASAVLGLGFAALDIYGAFIAKRGAEEAAAHIAERGGGKCWFVGHWGFQFYAERAGMEMAVPDYHAAPDPIPLPPPSRLRANDWLVVPDRSEQQPLRLDPGDVELVETLKIGARLPLETVPCYYGGRVPIDHQPGQEMTVKIYRVRRDFTPRLANGP